jgi:hypothetical protein
VTCDPRQLDLFPALPIRRAGPAPVALPAKPAQPAVTVESQRRTLRFVIVMQLPAHDDEVRVHYCTKESPRSRKTWGLSATVRGDTWGVGVTDADLDNAGGRPWFRIMSAAWI